MNKNKVTKIPITEHQRIRNIQGEYSVPCEISERWILFGKTSSKLKGGEFIFADIMTNTEEIPGLKISVAPSKDPKCKPRKICNLIITRENLLKVLSKIKAKD